MYIITQKKIHIFLNTLYSASVSWRGNYPLPNTKLRVFYSVVFFVVEEKNVCKLLKSFCVTFYEKQG